MGAWQPGTFPGFTVIEVPSSPSWFEYYASEHAAALTFYRPVFGWETDVVSDTDEFRYSTVRNPEGGGELAGLADGRAMLDGAPPDGRSIGPSRMSRPRWPRWSPWAARWKWDQTTRPMGCWRR